MAELTPMMRQYLSIKEKNPDSILFFRLGDFYEMFFDDARLVSKELDLVLTGKDCGLEERAPMCGVPFHSAENYIARLVAKGYRVAICEQVQDPKEAKGLVERDIIRIVTPGTVTEASMLEESRNNYIMALRIFKKTAVLAFADISTGELTATSVDVSESVTDAVLNETGRYSPREALVYGEGDINKIIALLREKFSCPVCTFTREELSEEQEDALLEKYFDKKYLKSCGLSEIEGGCTVIAMLLRYLEDMQKMELDNIREINVYDSGSYMQLDLGSRRNLELCETMRRGDKKGSLLWVLDKTVTPMGGRLIRHWIEKPLCDGSAITARHNAVSTLLAENKDRERIIECLKDVCDMERIISRITLKTANARDLKALQRAAEKLLVLKKELEGYECGLLGKINDELDPLEDLAVLLDTAIDDEPPYVIREGGIIKKGFDNDVDELRSLVKGSREVLLKMEADEKERTGIKTLKISFNKVFGYYIEVSNSYKDSVPPEYIRKQTLTNGERFITEELKILEDKILSAKEKVVALEYDIFCTIRDTIESSAQRIKLTAYAVARLDVLCSYATVAKNNRYVRPVISVDGSLSIKDGRHPVVEKMLKDSLFVPNDTELDCKENRLAIITGPNMAGKSTYMRQVAVLCLMSQAGSFVPAADANLPIVDKIFTRVGASDDLAAGQSTFMVEMNEVAYILKNATQNSLLILDEIGRGTSTFDGMSIARAVIEYAASHKLGAKTLFATHYHELTALEGKISGVKNYNIAVKKRGDDIIFLRRIVRGGTDDSYGIEVAKLAGVPQIIIDRAKEILEELESGRGTQTEVVYMPSDEDEQITLSGRAKDEFVEKIKCLDIDTLTPIESMNLLYKIKEEAKGL